jgi:di/tricarboxylate transporter
MDIKGIVAICFGIFVVLLIASTGAFTEIIKGFTSVMGFYGVIIGVLIVIALIIGFLGIGGKKR